MTRVLIALFFSLVSGHAMAGPKEDAEGVLQQFLTVFSEAKDLDRMTALFEPEAQFWGTQMPELGTATPSIRAYFENSFKSRANSPATARVVSNQTNVLTSDAVAIAGRWEVGRPSGAPSNLRFSAVIVRRDGSWKIAQFHSSPRPAN